MELNPKAIRVFDNNETALFDLEQELKSDKIRTLIGDIRDKDRLKELLRMLTLFSMLQPLNMSHYVNIIHLMQLKLMLWAHRMLWMLL